MPDKTDYSSDKEYSTARWYWYDTKNKYDARLTEIRESLSEYQSKKEKLLLPPPVDNARITELEAKRDELLAKGAKITTGGQDDIFSWLSEVLGPKPDMMQFILSLFPALFIDLLAPIASAIFFYGLGGLGVNNRGNKEFTEEDMQGAYREGADVAFGLVRESFK